LISPPRRLLRLVIVLLLAVVLLVVALRVVEPRLVFLPAREPVGEGPGERIELVTLDGLRLAAFWLERADSTAAVLYLHGNAGSLRGREPVVTALAQVTGASVLALDYRGYGESEGEPDEPGLELDARAGWDWLAARVAPERIVIWGESLGGGPATHLAQDVQRVGVPRALVLQSTFTRLPDMARRVIPLPGIDRLCRIRMDSLERVRAIRCPKLHVHSRADEVVPFELGERLYAEACEPKQALWVERVGHNDAWWSRDFVSRLTTAFASMR
jgi:uncharacterized protein